MTDRFDLEQQIMKCWNVTDDMDLLYRRYYNTDDMTKDDVANFLLGLITVYNCRFEEMFDTFSKLVKQRQLDTEVFKGKGLPKGTVEELKSAIKWAEDNNIDIGAFCKKFNNGSIKKNK